MKSLQSRTQTPLTIALLLLISVVVYWDFLTFTNLYLYKDVGSDTLNVFYPQYIHLADYLRSDGWPAWSFSQGMGQNIFPSSIGDPFELLLLLLGSENLVYGLVYRQVLEIALAGFIFHLYLRTLPIEPFTATLGALCYAFSGFMILGGTWYVFPVSVIYFTLLLYALERYLKDSTWIYIPVGVALVSAGSSFYLYVFVLFFLPYGIFRHYSCHGWRPKLLISFLLRMAGFAVLGVGISTVFLVANVLQMFNSPRGLGEVASFDFLLSRPLLVFEGFVHNLTAAMRVFSSDMLGTGNKFRGWGSYLEAPIFYCGLLPLLLAPQIFVHLDRKRRIAFSLFGLIFLIPVILPFFRYLFWAFTGNYYRLYSVFIVFIFLYFGLCSFDALVKQGRISVRLLLGTLVVLLTTLFVPYFWAAGLGVGAVDPVIWLLSICLLLVYTALLLALKWDKAKLATQRALLLVVCIELMGFSWQTVNDRVVVTAEEFQSKTGYNDHSVEAIAAIKKKDPGFYRIEKTFGSGPSIHRSINDAKVQGYFGTSSYHSFNQLNYIRFLDALEVIDGSVEASTRWARGIINDPLLTSFTSVKYVLVKQSSHIHRFTQYGYRMVGKQGDVSVMENTAYLPFGFTYESFSYGSEFIALPMDLRRVALIKAAIVEKSLAQALYLQLKEYDLSLLDPGYDMESFLADVNQRRSSEFEISYVDHNNVKGEIELDRPEILFFTLPFDRGWEATVNGEPAELMRVNIGFSGLLLSAGRHAVELRYHLPYFKLGLVISTISLIGLLALVWRERKLSSNATDIPC